MGYYRYGFNGKEKDTDGEWGENTTNYDFGARIYNPSIGKWLSTDPLQSTYSAFSPYTYSMNSPIWMYDPDGMSVDTLGDGRYVWEMTEYEQDVFYGREEFGKEWNNSYRQNELERLDLDDGIQLTGWEIAYMIGHYAGWVLPSSKVAQAANSSKNAVQHIDNVIDDVVGLSDDALDLIKGGSKTHIPEIPFLDGSGKVRTFNSELPSISTLKKVTSADLKTLANDLRISIQNRIKSTIANMDDATELANKSHAQRQAAEQDLLKSVEKLLENRGN